MDKKEDFETIKVNEKEDTREYTFPSLELSKFERQMRAFNSYSALDKFKNRTNVSPTFEFDTKGNLTSGNLLDLKNQGTSKVSIDYAGKISANGLDAGSNKITSVTDPTANQDAATKKYHDDNKYSSSDFDTDFSGKSTTDLSEGSNLYFTTGRIDSHLSGGDGISYSTGTISNTNLYYESTMTSGSQVLGDSSGNYNIKIETITPGFEPDIIKVIGQVNGHSGDILDPWWSTDGVSSNPCLSWGTYETSGGTYPITWRWIAGDNNYANATENTFFEVANQGAGTGQAIAGLKVNNYSASDFDVNISLEQVASSDKTFYYQYKVYCYKF